MGKKAEQQDAFGDDSYTQKPASKQTFQVTVTVKLKWGKKGGQTFSIPVIPTPVVCLGEEVSDILTAAVKESLFQKRIVGICGEQIGL